MKFLHTPLLFQKTPALNYLPHMNLRSEAGN